jgi:hypothetical protein
MDKKKTKSHEAILHECLDLPNPEAERLSNVPNMFDMQQNPKYWLMGPICILALNVIIFLFRKKFDLAVLFWISVLAPVAWLGLNFFTSLFERINKYFRQLV